MKEKLSNELKGLVGETSMSDKSWGDYIDNVVVPFVPQETDKQTEYLQKHAAYLKSQSGQYNKDIADKVKAEAERKFEEFKKNYKPEPTTQPQTQPITPPATPANDVETRLKAFEEWKTAQETEKVNSEKTAVINAKRTDVLNKLKAQGADNDVILELVENNLAIKEDSNVDDLLKEAKTIYEDRNTKLFGEGYNPAYGGNQQTRTVSQADRQKAIQDNVKKYRENLNV